MHFSLTDVLCVYLLCFIFLNRERPGKILSNVKIHFYLFLWIQRQVRIILFAKLFPIVLSLVIYPLVCTASSVVYYDGIFIYHISASFCQVLWNLPDALWINRAGTVSNRTKSIVTANQICDTIAAIHVLTLNMTYTVIGEAFQWT